jgi:hypothetical protein
MSDDAFYLTVLGEGSFSLGKDCPTWRGPATFSITPEQAEACLACKDANPDSNLFVVSATPPNLGPSGKPDWMLRPEDLSWRSETEAEHEFPDEPESAIERDAAIPDDLPPGDFACPQCGKTFTWVVGLRQHTALNHFRVFEQVEDDLRTQIAARKAAEAAHGRVKAEPDSLHPSERPAGAGSAYRVARSQA